MGRKVFYRLKIDCGKAGFLMTGHEGTFNSVVSLPLPIISARHKADKKHLK